MKKVKLKLIASLSQGKIEEVLQKLETLKKDKSFSSEIIVHKTNYVALTKAYRTNSISEEDYKVAFNRLVLALSDLIQELPETKNSSLFNKKYWIALGVLLLFMLCVFLYDISKLLRVETNKYNQKNITSKNQSLPNNDFIPLDTTISANDSQKIAKSTSETTIQQPKKETKNAPTNSTIFNGQTTVNGQIITNPTESITIKNDYLMKQDSIKK